MTRLSKSARVIAALMPAIAIVSYTGVASATWTNKSGGGSGAAGATSLGTPGSFSATCHSSSSREVDFTWTSVTTAGGYSIFDSTSLNGTYTLLQTVSGGNSTSANTSNNLNANTYYFKIEATVGNNWVGSLSAASGPRTITHVSGNSYTCS